MAMTQLTRQQQAVGPRPGPIALIEERLTEPLAKFISARRPGTAWRRIAIELTQLTGVDITGEALRLWHGRVLAAATSRRRKSA